MQETTRDKMKDKSRQIYLSNRLKNELSNFQEFPLTIIEAPMGYGKTTAVKEGLKNSNLNITTLKITEASKSLFWQSLCNWIRKSDESVAARLENMSFPDERLMVHDAVSLIESVLFMECSVLIIDDYYLIDCDEVNAFIECLIKAEIERLRILIVTRFIGLPDIEELKLKGYIKHIVKEDLEFTSFEIAQYYKLCGIKLTESGAETLYKYTEGWISAIYLLMLNFKDIESIEKIPNIYKLIDEAIYKHFSDEVKSFLLSMCLFNSFSLEQAKFMFEEHTQTNLLMVLNEVVYKNAFITYDPETRTYQMHHLFTNFLKNLLENYENANRLYERAGLWHLENREYDKAMHFFYLCRQFEMLIQTIEADKSNSFNGDNKNLLVEFMESCPMAIKFKYPLALLIYAMHLFTFNLLANFEKCCEDILQSIEMNTTLSDSRKSELLGEFELMISFTEFNDIQRMVTHHKVACDMLMKPTSIYDTNSRWTFGSFSVLYMFYRESGKLEQHVNDLIEAMPYYNRLTEGHGSGGDLLFEAERFFYMGDFESAEISVQKALLKAQNKSEIEMIMCAEFLQLRLSLMKGDFKALKHRLSNMKKNVQYRSDNFFVHMLELCEGYIYGLLGHADKISERLSDGDLTKTRLMFPAHGLINMVYERALLLQGEYLKLLGSIEAHMNIATFFPNVLAVIHIEIYQAAAFEKIGRFNEALHHIKEALYLAMPDQLIMPFVENGDVINPLLIKCANEGLYQTEIERIFSYYDVFSKTVKDINRLYFDSEKPKLSKREYEIAALAAEGLTNKEISEKLYISQNTIKTQLKAIFEKLEINSRVLLKKALSES
ncbi:helix-turn-helix transcriptional regulator [Fusibacter bizertensis]